MRYRETDGKREVDTLFGEHPSHVTNVSVCLEAGASMQQALMILHNI